MNATLSGAAALDRYFLETRCKILEIAANLDRIDRGGGATGDPRLKQVATALNLLLVSGPNRTEKCQQVFSLPYDANWKRPR